MKTKPIPAIAFLEISNMAAGLKSLDAMVKKSPIAVMKSGRVSRGKYLILIGGSVAAVDEAFREGLHIAGTDCLDSVMLPDVHPVVFNAMSGEREPAARESLGIIETPHLATNIAAADAAIKGATVSILEMGMGDGYDGKGYTLFNGAIEDVEAALRVACEVVVLRQSSAETEIIPRMAEETRIQLNDIRRFGDAPVIDVEGGEV